MKTNRVSIEIVILGTAIACVLALLAATLGAATGAAEGEADARQQTAPRTDQSYEGMVTCSRCGAKHSATPRADYHHLYPRLCARWRELCPHRCGRHIPPIWRPECSEKASRATCPPSRRA